MPTLDEIQQNNDQEQADSATLTQSDAVFRKRKEIDAALRPPAEEGQTTLSRIGNFATRNITGALMAPLQGAEEFVRQGVEALDDITGDHIQTKKGFFFGTPDTVIGDVLSTVTQFVIPFGIVGKVLKPVGWIANARKAGKLASLAVTTGEGALANFIAFDPEDHRLSDALLDYSEKVPAFKNPITEMLAHDTEWDSKTEHQFKERLKNAAEGTVVGSAVDGLLALGKISALRKAIASRRLTKNGEMLLDNSPEGIAQNARLIDSSMAFEELRAAEASAAAGKTTRGKAADGVLDATRAEMAPVTGAPAPAAPTAVTPRPPIDWKADFTSGMASWTTGTDDFSKGIRSLSEEMNIDVGKLRTELNTPEAYKKLMDDYFTHQDYLAGKAKGELTPRQTQVASMESMAVALRQQGVDYAKILTKDGKPNAFTALERPTGELAGTTDKAVMTRELDLWWERYSKASPEKQADDAHALSDLLMNKLNININRLAGEEGSTFAGTVVRFMDDYFKSKKIPDNETFAKSMGFLADPAASGADVVPFMRQQFISELTDLSKTTGESMESLAVRFGNGEVGLFKGVETIDYRRLFDADVMKRMHMRVIAYRAELAVQAKELQNFASKMGSLDDVSRAEYVDALNRFPDMLRQVKELSSGAGRNLRSFRRLRTSGLKSMEELNALAKEHVDLATGGNPHYLDYMSERLNAIFQGSSPYDAALDMPQTKSGFWDKRNDWWINAVLSSPKTHIINSMTSLFRTFYEPVSTFIGATTTTRLSQSARNIQMQKALKQEMEVINSMFSAIRTLGVMGLKKAHLLEEGAAPTWSSLERNATGRNVVESFKNLDSTLQGGRSAVRDILPKSPFAARAPKAGDTIFGDAIRNSMAWLGDNVINVPSRFLVSADELFKNVNFHATARANLWEEGVHRFQPLLYANQLSNEEFSKMVEDFVDLNAKGMNLPTGARLQRYGAKRFATEASAVEGGNSFKQKSNANKLNEKLINTQLSPEDLGKFSKTLKGKTYTKGADGLSYTHDEESIKNLISMDADSRFAVSDKANRYADEITFTGGLDSDLEELRALDPNFTRSSLQKRVQDMGQYHPFMRVFFPFVRTPSNILRYVGQRTLPIPALADLPLLRDLHVKLRGDLLSKNPTRIAEAQGRLTSSLLFYGAAGTLVMGGSITGNGSTDSKIRKQMEATGWQPYSFKLPNSDTYVSYKRFDPFSTFFSLVADTVEYMQQAHSEDADEHQNALIAGVLAVSNGMVNKTYLSNLSNALEALQDPERKGEQFAINEAAGYVPRAIAEFAPMADQDGYVRQARTVLESIQKQFPVISSGLDPARNILGEPVSVSKSNRGAVAILSMFNPAQIRTDRHDDIMDGIAQLNHGFQMPSPYHKGIRSLNMHEYRMPDGHSVYDRVMELSSEVKLGGKDVRSALRSLMASNLYNKIPDLVNEADFGNNPKKALISAVLGRYRDAAVLKVYKENPLFFKATQAALRGRSQIKAGSPYGNPEGS